LTKIPYPEKLDLLQDLEEQDNTAFMVGQNGQKLHKESQYILFSDLLLIHPLTKEILSIQLIEH
jgi:hypothetical protein